MTARHQIAPAYCRPDLLDALRVCLRRHECRPEPGQAGALAALDALTRAVA